jgi:alcohol dehydrogenase class IV
MEHWDFHLPTKVRFGWGRLAEIADIVKSLGGTRVFLVTGKSSARISGALDRIRDALKRTHIELFDQVEENPSIETVDRGAARCRTSGCDLVIGVGGGSPLDAGKAIAMLQMNDGSIREYLDQEKTCQAKGLPFVAVTTTSGTGSEVTPFAVITHHAKKAKPAIAPAQLFPDVAIVDPELTRSMPFRIALSSGLDALDQAVEGFWSTRASTLTRTLAGRGIVLAMRNLERACRDKDRESVTNMALASHLTGLQMSSVANTAIHPLSYPFTIDYGIIHGFACAIFLPAFLRFNAEVVGGLFDDVLRLLGLSSVESFADAVDDLMARLGAPKRLSDFGVTEEELPALVKRGVGRSTESNPRPLRQEDLVNICRSIL